MSAWILAFRSALGLSGPSPRQKAVRSEESTSGQACRPPGDIRIEENTLFPGLAEPELSKAVCFPFAQHYIADSPGRRTFVKDRGDLVGHYNRLAESEGMKTFSARTIVMQLAFGIAASLLLAAVLVLVL